MAKPFLEARSKQLPQMSPLWRKRHTLKWLKYEAGDAKGREAAQTACGLAQSRRPPWRRQTTPSVWMSRQALRRAEPDSVALVFPDNTANITVKYGQFDRERAKVHHLPVLISDNGRPSLTGTSTLVVTICKCNEHGEFTHCEEMAGQAGVSIQALVAIFLCILTITGQCPGGWGGDTRGAGGCFAGGGRDQGSKGQPCLQPISHPGPRGSTAEHRDRSSISLDA